MARAAQAATPRAPSRAMSSRNGGADPGAYWGLVRVERKADKGAVPQVLQRPAHFDDFV